VERALLANATAKQQEWVMKKYRSMSMFIDGAKEITDALDPRRLGFLHPGTVRMLLEKGTVVDHARYFPLAADLLCLTRSMSSKIPMDFEGDEVFDCRKNIKPVFVKTITTEFFPEEKAEQQHQHRDASRRFLQAIRAPSNRKDDRPVYPVAEMRELQLTTASTKLRVFHDICKSIGKDSLTDSMTSFRENGFDGWTFVRFICTKTGTALPTTALGYMTFMCEGSPLLRTLIKQVCAKDRHLNPRKEGKLFVLDDTPLIAMFLSWSLNMMGVDTALFHSGLANVERDQIQADFNDKSSRICVMVCLYEVGGVGRNFHKDCHHAILTSAAKNQSSETQSMGRLVRVSYHILVFDVCLILTNVSRRHKRKTSSSTK
jgi:hypothetical protein